MTRSGGERIGRHNRARVIAMAYDMVVAEETVLLNVEMTAARRRLVARHHRRRCAPEDCAR